MSEEYNFVLLIEQEDKINELLSEYDMSYHMDESSMFDKYPSITVIQGGEKVLDCVDLEEGYDLISQYVNLTNL